VDLARVRTLSPRDIAAACGVSESSVKRWIDGGQIVAGRTGGGHRRVALQDALRFIRARGLPVPHPGRLGLDADPALGGFDTRGLVEALEAMDGLRVRGLIAGAYLVGTPLAALFDGPVRDAAERLGTLCQDDFDDGVATEHGAMALLSETMGYLAGLLPPIPTGAPVAVGGALPHDPYVLASQMAALVLAEAGWSTLNLGALLPVSALAHAALTRGARLVWLSCSVEVEGSGLAAIEAFAAKLSAAGICVVAGGKGAGPLRDVAGVEVGERMADLVRIAASVSAEQTFS